MKGYIDDLQVLKTAEKLADGIWSEVGSWRTFEKDTIGKQLARSADSIGANIAEAYGRYHYGEKKQFLYYARGSLFETKYWLNRTKQRNLIDKAISESYINQIHQLGKELNNFIAYIKRAQKSTKPPTKTLKEPDLIYETDNIDIPTSIELNDL